MLLLLPPNIQASSTRSSLPFHTETCACPHPHLGDVPPSVLRVTGQQYIGGLQIPVKDAVLVEENDGPVHTRAR